MKGISEIVSAIVILGIGISLVSIYAQWAPNFAGELGNTATNQSNQRIQCSNAAFSINSAEYDRSSNATIFHLENEGTIRFARGLSIGVLNSSTEITRKNIQNLDVGENRRVAVSAGRIPSTIIVTSNDCPEVDAVENSIDVHQ